MSYHLHVGMSHEARRRRGGNSIKLERGCPHGRASTIPAFPIDQGAVAIEGERVEIR